MLKPVCSTFLLFVLALKVSGQDSLLTKISEYKKQRGEIITNKNIYKRADLLVKNHLVGVITPAIYRLADSLDKLHPKFYFGKAEELIKQFRLNDAAFIYYLGSLRYRYYNAANPYFKAAEDGAVFSKLQSDVGPVINMYLTVNYDNFVEIVKKSGDWFLNHDYRYFSRSNNTMEFLIVADGVTKLITELEKDKTRYIKDWKIERMVIEENFNRELKEIDVQLNQSARE